MCLPLIPVSIPALCLTKQAQVSHGKSKFQVYRNLKIIVFNYVYFNACSVVHHGSFF